MRAKVLGYAEPFRVRWESLALLGVEGCHCEASSIAMVVCYGVGLLLYGFWRSVCPELYGCDMGDALGFWSIMLLLADSIAASYADSDVMHKDR